MAKLTDDQKAKMALWRTIAKEAKEYISDKKEFDPALYQKLCRKVVSLEKIISDLRAEMDKINEVKEVMSSIKEPEEKIIENEEKTAPSTLEPNIDVWSVETSKKRWPSWPQTKVITWVPRIESVKEAKLDNLTYFVISKKVNEWKLGKVYKQEKWGTWRVVRYVEKEMAEARLAQLREEWFECKMSKPFVDEIPSNSEKQVLTNRYNNGYLVLSDKKLRWLGMTE